ncbi:type 4a pilus biogenesis protein PilO, partial [Leptospira sp. SA-E8]|uniref:type 4a pilus biogenesis protein PilO n=1 Tax=Leptospira sp. SA-E8 TaxID=3422259 RepID=UPI003EBFD994
MLSQINRAGRQHDLRFELFRPGPFVTHPYYVEMPITLRVTGDYHDIGAFAADLANHPRILVLDLLTLNQRTGTGGPASDRGNPLTLEAVVRAYRAPGPDDQSGHKRAAANGGRP